MLDCLADKGLLDGLNWKGYRIADVPVQSDGRRYYPTWIMDLDREIEG